MIAIIFNRMHVFGLNWTSVWWSSAWPHRSWTYLNTTQQWFTRSKGNIEVNEPPSHRLSSGRRVRARWHPVPLISRNPAISDVTNTPWHWVDEIRHSKSPKALHGQSSCRAVHQRHRRLFFIPTWIWTLFVIRQWHARPADYGCNLVMALISHFLSILTLLILLQSTNGKMLLHLVQSQTVKCLKHYNGFCYWWWCTTQATD